MAAAQRRPGAAEIVTAGATAAVSVVALAAVALLLSTDALGPPEPVTALSLGGVLVTLLVQCALLPLQRRSPLAGMVAVAAVPIVTAVAAPGPLFSLTVLPVLVAVYRAGVRASSGPLPASPRLWLGVAAAALAVTTGQLIDTSAAGVVGIAGGAGVAGAAGVVTAVAAAIGQAVVVVGSALLLALAVAGRRAARRSHEAELQALAREREALVGEAVAQERAAMARELHDIAAHHLSGIALMTSAIDRQLATDPQAARDGVRQVRAQSMAVLDDLRRLVGLLRDPSESVEAVQTLDTLPSLLDVARSAGSPVRLDVVRRAGSERLGDGVGPLGQLAAYRMVQESLTNAVTHAPAAASTVTLDDSDDDRFVVTVQTEATPARPHAAAAAGRPAPGGFGILGMRERAALVGGTLASGPTPDGGWLTRMELPRDGRRSTGPEEGTRP